MRTAGKLMLLALVLAAPSLLIGVLSDGPYSGRVFQGGLVMLGVVAVFAVVTLLRGARADREQDERERLILYRALSFTSLVAAVGIQAYWAFQFAGNGNAGDDSFWLLALFWGAFAVAYGYNNVRAR